jgi:hypothetical protein
MSVYNFNNVTSHVYVYLCLCVFIMNRDTPSAACTYSLPNHGNCCYVHNTLKITGQYISIASREQGSIPHGVFTTYIYVYIYTYIYRNEGFYIHNIFFLDTHFKFGSWLRFTQYTVQGPLSWSVKIIVILYCKMYVSLIFLCMMSCIQYCCSAWRPCQNLVDDDKTSQPCDKAIEMWQIVMTTTGEDNNT